MEIVAIVAVVVLAEYLYFVYQVGRARQRCGLPAPHVTGNAEFERYYRVQQNTLEQLAVFLPALWMAAWFADVNTAAAAGIAFALGRAMYYRAYVNNPSRRGPGFALTLAANAVLLLSALAGALARLPWL